MSDTAKRDAKLNAVLAEYRIDRTAPVVPGVMRVIAGHDGLAMADEIVRLRAIESAARRMVAAQERMGHGSWFPSAEDIEECDAAWDDLRTALDAAREEG